MKTLPKILHLSVLLLVIQARGAWGVEILTGTPDRVGNLGDPARLSIEGGQTFTEGDMRRALQSDLDYLVAAHPEASLSECLAVVEQRIRAGYRYCGFPDVSVQARFEVAAGRIVAKVSEGSRFHCGALQVTGLKTIPVADFTRRFAEKLAPAPAQAMTAPWTWWKAGSPVNFTPESLANCSAAASNTFAALGHFAAKFKVELQPQPASTNAALVVIVEDEGPAAVLREIEVVGNQKNRRDDVIGFLGLTKGMKLTQDLIDEKTRALTQAARFVDASITPTVVGPAGQVSLRINVVERAQLPPLQQSLSREEQTLLRLREWLLAWESRQDDLIVDWSEPRLLDKKPLAFEVIVAPSGGIMARVRGNSPGQEHPQDLYSAIIKARALSVFAQVHQRKLQIPLPPGNSGLIFVKVERDANATDKFKLTMGAGLSSAQTNDNWRLRLELLPAAFADLLYRPETQATWQGDVLTIRTKEFLLRVDEGTGRLVEFGLFGGNASPGAGASDAYRVAVRFTTGAFAKAVDQIAANTSAYPDAFQSQRAYGSALGFIAAEVALAEPLWSSVAGGPKPAPKTALASALEKLLAGSFLDPLQKLLDEAKPPRSIEEFTIPSKTKEDHDEFQQAIEGIMVWCAGHAQELTPAGSWLQTLLHESAFSLNSRTEHQTAALTGLAETDNLGPIGCFAALHMFPAANRDWQATICDLGLRRMATDDFRGDYRRLLDSQAAITHCLANLARELGTLTPPEIEAIAKLLPPDGAVLMREIALAARKTNNQPVTDAIGPVLDRWWETSAKGGVEAAFRFHAQQLARAKTGQPRPQSEQERQEAKLLALHQALNNAINKGDYPEALRLLEGKLDAEQAQFGPTNQQTLRTIRQLADLAGCVAAWDVSVRHLRVLMELSGCDLVVLRGCAVASLLDGDDRSYRAVCARILAEYGATTDIGEADMAAKVCLLIPGAVPDLKPVFHLADMAAATTNSPDFAWFGLVKGMAEYRGGNLAEAVRWLNGLRTNDDPRIASLAGLFCAMAQHRLLLPELARHTLDAANHRYAGFLQMGDLSAPNGPVWWFDGAAVILIRAEAERLILGREVSARPTTDSLAAARRAWWTMHVKLGCDYPAELLQQAAWKSTWSPDNKHIAFGRHGGGIAVLDLASRQVTDLVSQGKDPAWSPDGKLIAWVSGGYTDGSEEVWIVPATGGQPVKIGQGGFPAWSADSTKVILHNRQSNRMLSVKVAAPEEPPTVFFEKPLSWYPAISPDGARIAFGAGEKLVIVDRATGETVASLATPGERGLLPCWSPDGRQVAFGGFAGSQAGLWIFDVERGGAFQVAKKPGCTMPAWSPDGENLVFDFRAETNELWIIKTQNLPREPRLTNSLPARVEAGSPGREPAETSLVGKPVPGTFTLALLEGGEFTLPSTQNTNIVLLDFWATWCGPCRQVMPTLAEISKEYASRGVRYVAVNLREKPEVIRNYLAKANLNITVALDTDGKMADAYQVRGIPTMVVVDRHNVVRKVHVGASPQAGDDLRRALDEVLQSAEPVEAAH